MSAVSLTGLVIGIGAYVFSARAADRGITAIADKKIFNTPLKDVITFSAVVLTPGMGAAALIYGQGTTAALLGMIGIAIAARRLSESYELQSSFPFYQARPAARS